MVDVCMTKRDMGERRSEKSTFSKDRRILKRSEFVRLSKINRKVFNQHFVALYHPSVTGRTRLGVTVTKTVGNAVARNQLKRYVREFFRRNQHMIQNGMDINIIVKKQASGIPSKEVFQSLQHIFCKIRD